jgi:prephenate dehydratase
MGALGVAPVIETGQSLPTFWQKTRMATPAPLKIGFLGPSGSNAEAAALSYLDWLKQAGTSDQKAVSRVCAPQLCPYPSIAQALRAISTGNSQQAVVPVENSIEGSVTMTLDSLWQLEELQILQALVLPISHALVTQATDLSQIETIYSHPQALSQCQYWLEQWTPAAQLIPTPSTTEALKYPAAAVTAAAIASERAAAMYNLPILAQAIQDYPDNCTRFLVLGAGQAAPTPPAASTHTALAFSLPANAPGALLKPLQIFSDRKINLSRLESRPSKRALGDYVFFVELEINQNLSAIAEVLSELAGFTDVLKVLGHYQLLEQGR